MDTMRANLLRTRIAGAAFALAVAVSFAPGPAVAADPFCKGTINDIFVSNTGDVLVLPTWRNDWVWLCNLNTARAVVQPKTCSSWLAAVMMAHATGKFTTITYDWGTVCSTLPTYGASPLPHYVMLNQ